MRKPVGNTGHQFNRSTARRIIGARRGTRTAGELRRLGAAVKKRGARVRKLVRRQRVVRLLDLFQVRAPDTDGDADVHVLRPLAFLEVRLGERAQPEIIELVVARKVDKRIDGVGVVVHNVPERVGNDVAQSRVDVPDAFVRGFLEVVHENACSEHGIIRVLGRQRDSSVGSDLVQRLGADIIVDGRTRVLRHATDVGCGNCGFDMAQFPETVRDLFEMHGLVPPVPLDHLHLVVGYTNQAPLRPLLLHQSAFVVVAPVRNALLGLRRPCSFRN